MVKHREDFLVKHSLLLRDKSPLFLGKTTLIWSVLMLATGLSWWLGADHGLGANASPARITVVVMLVAFIKVRLVIRHFMEVRDAPLPLKLILEGWVVVACSAVIGMYLFGPK